MTLGGEVGMGVGRENSMWLVRNFIFTWRPNGPNKIGEFVIVFLWRDPHRHLLLSLSVLGVKPLDGQGLHIKIAEGSQWSLGMDE